MDWTLFFAVLAGLGGGAAWGYRTALHVALGKASPPLPREPNAGAQNRGQQSGFPKALAP